MNARIRREDVEHSLRAWKDQTEGELTEAKGKGIGAVVAVALSAVGTAYALGRRRKKSEKTYIEVTRVR